MKLSNICSEKRLCNDILRLLSIVLLKFQPGPNLHLRVIDLYTKVVTLVINLCIPILGHVVMDGMILFQLRAASGTLGKREKDVTVSMLLVCLFYLFTASVIALTMAKYSTMEVNTSKDVVMRRLLILGAVSSN